jgi:hypothetical protein
MNTDIPQLKAVFEEEFRQQEKSVSNKLWHNVWKVE